MLPSAKRLQRLALVLILIGGIVPLLWYVAALGSVPSLSPSEAVALLARPGAEAVLIDVRPAESFAQQHVVGAQSWPLEQLQALRSTAELPAGWQGKTLVVMCATGLGSADAVRRLQAMGVPTVFSVRGGLQAWGAAVEASDPNSGAAYTTLAGEPLVRQIPLLEQWAAVAGAFLFKPTYMALSLLLIVALWRARTADLVALKWSMAAFLFGEACCAANYILFNESSYLAEYLHSYGMVVAFGLALYAMGEGLDRRVFQLSAAGQRCAALELCRPCIKSEAVDCGARKGMLLLLPLLALLPLIPLLAPLSLVSYNTVILGTPYNYTHLVIYQLFERRYSPALALLLLALAFFVLLRQPRRPISPTVRILAMAGLGALAFAFFRLLFGMVFQNDLLLAVFWEELTELAFLIGAWGLLLLFRETMLAEVAGVWPWTLVSRVLPLPQPTPPLSDAGASTATDLPVALVACQVLRDPLTRVLPSDWIERAVFLDYGLHRYPERLRQSVQQVLDSLPEPHLVVLGYGLCGNGLRGVRAGRHTLLIPRVDDCIPLLLGSHEAYRAQVESEPATFYLSKGWLESGSHPLREYQDCLARYGAADAEMIVDTQYQHFRRLALVAGDRQDLDRYREQAMEVARFCERWGMRYEEIAGSDLYIQKLAAAVRAGGGVGDDLLLIRPGEIIESRHFSRGW